MKIKRILSFRKCTLVLVVLVVVAVGLCASRVLPSGALTATNVSPKSGPTAGGTTVTITGTDFQQMAGWKQMVAGDDYTCALNYGGQFYCWGWNQFGQLGDGTTVDKDTPTRINSGDLSGKTITAIAAGQSHACAVDTSGRLYCWGTNGYGQLGDGTNVISHAPVLINGGDLAGKTVTAVAAGFYHACALTSEGKVYCWGRNMYGEVGDGTTTQRDVPALASGGDLAGKTVVAIMADGYHTCAIDTNSRLYCWGNNNVGQLGDGTTVDKHTPTLINGGDLTGRTIATITGGYNHTCALDNVNRVYCWGWNQYGQLGDGTNTDKDTPVLINGGDLAGKTVATLKAGGTYNNGLTCAVDVSGWLYCWGRNNEGQLGDGTTTNKNVPTLINGGALAGKTTVLVVGGYRHTCAVDIDNEIYCWGNNSRGQFGDGTTNNQSTPVLVDTSGLSMPPAILTVTFGGLECTNVAIISNTELTCVTPAHVAGLVDVVVAVNGKSVTLRSAFEYRDVLDAPDSGVGAGNLDAGKLPLLAAAALILVSSVVLCYNILHEEHRRGS